jgi:hypothetical protein
MRSSIPPTTASKVHLCSHADEARIKTLLIVLLREFELTKIFSYLEQLRGFVHETTFYQYLAIDMKHIAQILRASEPRLARLLRALPRSRGPRS